MPTCKAKVFSGNYYYYCCWVEMIIRTRATKILFGYYLSFLFFILFKPKESRHNWLELKC
jgi:hypothetical protein